METGKRQGGVWRIRDIFNSVDNKNKLNKVDWTVLNCFAI